MFFLLRDFKKIDLRLVTLGVRNQQLQFDFNDIHGCIAKIFTLCT